MKIRFLSLPEILFIHSVIIDETGGSHGIRDQALLESAVLKIEQTFGGKDLYPGLHDKAAALFLGLLKNHPFVDGNKRTAAVVLGVFLEMNGKILKADPVEFANWVDSRAASRPDQTAVLAWIRRHCH